MDKPTKRAICGVMGVGAITSVCAVAKAVFLKELFELDYTWYIYKPAICTIIEHLLGIVIASVPALKPIYSKIVANVRSNRYLSKRRFRKLYGSDGSLPLNSSSKVDSTKDKGQTPPPDNKAIVRTSEFYRELRQFLDTVEQEELASARLASKSPALGVPQERSRASMC